MSRAEKAIQSNDPEQAQAAVNKTIISLDKAAQKKIIHPNTVSRRKSRLMKKLNKVTASATAKVETKTTGEEE